MTTLREFVEDIDRGVVAPMFARRGAFPATWFVIERSGDQAIVPAPNTDKDTASAIMRALLEIVGATRCVFVDEAWTVIAKDEEASAAIRAITRDGSLENFPGRDEIVMYSAEDAREGGMTARRKIIREPGKKPRLGPLVIDDGWTRSEGRFVGMLPRPPGARSQ